MYNHLLHLFISIQLHIVHPCSSSASHLVVETISARWMQDGDTHLAQQLRQLGIAKCSTAPLRFKRVSCARPSG